MSDCPPPFFFLDFPSLCLRDSPWGRRLGGRSRSASDSIASGVRTGFQTPDLPSTRGDPEDLSLSGGVSTASLRLDGILLSLMLALLVFRAELRVPSSASASIGRGRAEELELAWALEDFR